MDFGQFGRGMKDFASTFDQLSNYGCNCHALISGKTASGRPVDELDLSWKILWAILSILFFVYHLKFLTILGQFLMFFLPTFSTFNNKIWSFLNQFFKRLV